MKKFFLVFGMIMLIACSKQPAEKIKYGSAEFKSGKEKIMVSLTMQDDKIIELSIDETYQGSTKKTLKEAYDLKVVSDIGKEWYEQIVFLENYILENGSEIEVAESGRAMNQDVLAGCTIAIDDILNAINSAKLTAE